MNLSNTFSTLSRVFKHYEKFGKEGYALWKSKTAKEERIKGYDLKGFQHKLFLRTHTSDYNAFVQIFFDNQYDHPIDFTPSVIIDCGANIGLASVFFANKFPNAKIIAVEPEKTNFELLKMNTVAYPNIHCLNNGIWDKETNLEIIDPGLGNWAFITKEVDYSNEHTIAALSINDIMRIFKIEKIDILKMDVEGAEKKIFSNGYETWLHKTKLIIIELHDRMEKNTSKVFFNAIRDLDYDMEILGENIFCNFS